MAYQTHLVLSIVSQFIGNLSAPLGYISNNSGPFKLTSSNNILIKLLLETLGYFQNYGPPINFIEASY